MRLLPERRWSLDVDGSPREVSDRLRAALGAGEGIAGRVEGTRAILWYRGPVAANAFRRRLRLRVEPAPSDRARLVGSLAVHPRVAALFGALMAGAAAFFAAALYVVVVHRTAMPLPFLLMPAALWGIRTLGLAVSRAEEERLLHAVEKAARQRSES